MPSDNPVLQYIENNFERFVHELSEYSKIPSVSFSGFPKEPLQQAALWTKNRMQQAGLENVEFLEIDGAPPYVYGDWLHAPDSPTLLLYAHYDVQPPGRPEKWISPPFTPERRGDRLYGRGTADDKGGGLMHLAAIEAYLKTIGKLPVNVKFLIEGEEEIGSNYLFEFLERYQKKLKSDVMVLTDTSNLDVGLPSLTYRLRGLVDATVEVRTLDHPVHSGVWGGPAVDALTILSKILARLTTDEGKIAIPDFYEGIQSVQGIEKERLARLPLNESQFRSDLGSVSSLEFGGEKEFTLYERLWCRPSVAILAVDAPSVAETSNKIVEWARAKVSIRIVSGMDPEKSLEKLCKFLEKDPPYHAQVKVTPGTASDSWYVEPVGPAYDAAVRALKKGYETDPVFIGSGASIPFVEPFSKAFGNIPCLLMGVEDPLTNAHGENESLHLGDWKKGMLASVYLYAEKFEIRISKSETNPND